MHVEGFALRLAGRVQAKTKKMVHGGFEAHRVACALNIMMSTVRARSSHPHGQGKLDNPGGNCHLSQGSIC